jgi:hypothetical protein
MRRLLTQPSEDNFSRAAGNEVERHGPIRGATAGPPWSLRQRAPSSSASRVSLLPHGAFLLTAVAASHPVRSFSVRLALSLLRPEPLPRSHLIVVHLCTLNHPKPTSAAAADGLVKLRASVASRLLHDTSVPPRLQPQSASPDETAIVPREPLSRQDAPMPALRPSSRPR